MSDNEEPIAKKPKINPKEMEMDIDHDPEPDHTEPSLLVLNDDCMLKLFDFLNPLNLSNMAHVNKRLNALAKFYMRLKYKIAVYMDFERKSTNIQADMNVKMVEKYLYTLGKQMTKLKLSWDSFDRTFNNFSSLRRVFSFIQ